MRHHKRVPVNAMAVCAAAAYVLQLPVALSADTIAPPADTELRVLAQVKGYAANFEYHNAHVEGRTLFGGQGQALLSWAVSAPAGRRITTAAGIYMRRDFGDTSFASDLLPLLLVEWQRGPLALRLGLLRSDGWHGLPPALCAETRDFVQGVEEGVQVLLDLDHIDMDAWVAWLGLNTPSHREHFVAGISTGLAFGPVSVPLALTVEHYGGEQYAPPDDPVRQNVAGTGGVRLAYPLRSRLREVGGEVLGYGSYVDGEVGNPSAARGGWGVSAALWLRPFDVYVGLSGFYGQRFTVWMGDSVFQTGEPYAALSVSRTVDLGRLAQLQFGLRLELIDRPLADYFRDGEHRAWLSLRCSLDECLWRRGDKTAATATE